MSPAEFLTEKEIFLFNHGELYHSYLKFGAHPLEVDGRVGVHFAVWAPRAQAVSVAGSFNDWRAGEYELAPCGSSGVWRGFFEGLSPGMLYKYAVVGPDGHLRLKADPFAFRAELRPATASIISGLAAWQWHDDDWIRQRSERDFRLQPLLIYELHPASWRRHDDGSFYTFYELADELIPYVTEMGFNHIELLPLMEHPLDDSWGYQITSYFAPTSRYGDAEGLKYLVERCHQSGIGVIMDWVPGHFCPDAHGLARFDGLALYETDQHRHWGTYKFDFARSEVWSFLISNAMYWLERFHVDGLRVDGVSSMLYLNFDREDYVPNAKGGRENLEAVAFLQQLNRTVLSAYPGVMMIAEESTDWPLVTAPPHDGGLGFSFKWNMGWMNDTLDYFATDFDERSAVHELLTFSMLYSFSENFILPLSHDEMVHGKRSLIGRMPGDRYEQLFAGMRLLYMYQLSHPGGKLLFMGSEFAQFIEWDHRRPLDWFLLDYEAHRWYHHYVRTMNALYRREACLWREDHSWRGFKWIDADNRKQGILVFQRMMPAERGAAGECLLLVINMQDKAYNDFRAGVPDAGWYQEIMNTDAKEFGGSGGWLNKRVPAEKRGWQGQPHSLLLKLPPLGGVILKRLE
ncbi:MAG: 1,4-alpha-glucan branching protein GlgB [Syntrophomonadaceae bacterium]|nr:1,4-alpha-glucan branching protein GlgB [Syntrophomonadaceae bacterium]